MMAGSDADVRVDQRSAYDAGTLSDDHVIEPLQVQPAVLPLWVVHIERQVRARDAGIVLGLRFPPAFQRENALACLGQMAGSGRTAEAASNNHGVEVWPWLFFLRMVRSRSGRGRIRTAGSWRQSDSAEQPRLRPAIPAVPASVRRRA